MEGGETPPLFLVLRFKAVMHYRLHCVAGWG